MTANQEFNRYHSHFIMPATPARTGIYDIFYHILPYLTPDPKPYIDSSLDETRDSRSVRQTLVRLARVHSSFTRPALAMAWRSLHSQKTLEYLLRIVRIARKPLRRQPGKLPQDLVRSMTFLSLIQLILSFPGTVQVTCSA